MKSLIVGTPWPQYSWLIFRSLTRKAKQMKWYSLFALTLTALSFAAVVNAKGKPATATFVEAKDMKWTEVPGFPGVQTAVVEGDPAKGPHHSFMKFNAGFNAPMHHHTSNHFVTVISGTLVLTTEGMEHNLPAGSYFSFNNKTPHKTACAAGADCVLFLDVRGKWDIVPEKPTKM
jgi:quercetin dioxygenase-like cupin family protein